jgi:hypothetical protein
VVRAMRNKSRRNSSSSEELSMAEASRADRAAVLARRHPSAMVWGWILWAMRCSASRLRMMELLL